MSEKFTPGPWMTRVFCAQYGVNPGPNPYWKAPSHIPIGQCAACANPKGKLVGSHIDKRGLEIHHHCFPIDDWHDVYSADGTQIIGNYDYEDSGVCTSEADARLIAAAPDLYEACKNLLLAIGMASLCDEPLTPRDQSLVDARAAIAKAEGEAHAQES